MGRLSAIAGALALASVAGCGDEAATIRVSSFGARWMAVRASDTSAWQRFDGPDATFEASGPYDIVVVCRDDIGDGWSMRATPADGTVWTRRCRFPGGVIPTFQVTGEADLIFVGNSATYFPSMNGVDIPIGTYDVVAMQLAATGQRVTKLQVIRDVVVDGATPIPIDIDALGVPPGVATLTADGMPVDFVSVTGWTARATWFSFFGGGAQVIPDALLADGDRQEAQVWRGRTFANVPVHEGANDVVMPVDDVDATYHEDGNPSVTWRSPSSFDMITFQVAQYTSLGTYPPWWRTYNYAGAIAADTVAGEARAELVQPDVPGWNPAWMTDLTMDRTWSISLQRDRADSGTEGVFVGERLTPSTSR